MTKKFIEVQITMLTAFSIILFYKVMWFDGQDIGVEQRKPMFNPPFTNIYYVKNVYLHIYLVHVCKCI